MERLTKYDSVRSCYVIRPEAAQGKLIQNLGVYEDRDEVCIPYGDGGKIIRCGGCNGVIPVENEKLYTFCPWCGQRLREDEPDEC